MRGEQDVQHSWTGPAEARRGSITAETVPIDAEKPLHHRLEGV